MNQSEFSGFGFSKAQLLPTTLNEGDGTADSARTGTLEMKEQNCLSTSFQRSTLLQSSMKVTRLVAAAATVAAVASTGLILFFGHSGSVALSTAMTVPLGHRLLDADRPSQFFLSFEGESGGKGTERLMQMWSLSTQRGDMIDKSAPVRYLSKSFPTTEEAASLPPKNLVKYLTFEITHASFKEFERMVDDIATKMTSEQWNAFVRYVLNDMPAAHRKYFKPVFQTMIHKVAAHKKDFVTPEVAASFPSPTLYLYIRDVVTQGGKEDFDGKLKRLGRKMTSNQLNAFARFVSRDLSDDHEKEFRAVFRCIANAYQKNRGNPMCHEKECYLGHCVPLNITTTHKLGYCCTAPSDQCSLIESGLFFSWCANL